ncbi:MAG TPA: hypothetical protein VFC92_03690 [Bacteroidales bacterium]|nr:hypothetical protein [Bacteroidales bacterium]
MNVAYSVLFNGILGAESAFCDLLHRRNEISEKAWLAFVVVAAIAVVAAVAELVEGNIGTTN